MEREKKAGAVAPKHKRSVWGKAAPPLAQTTMHVSAVDAAVLNVTSRGIPDQDIVAAAVNFIGASVTGRPGKAQGQIRRLAKRVGTGGLTDNEARALLHPRRGPWPDVPLDALRHAYSLPADGYEGPLSVAGFAASMISRRHDEEVVSALEKALSISHEKHGEFMRQCRQSYPGIYPLILEAKLGSALQLALRSGPGAIAATRNLVHDHAIFLAIATANIRIKNLRTLSRSPLGVGFAGRNQWLNLGHCCTAVLAQPAGALVDLLDMQIPADVGDSDAIAAAITVGRLPQDDSSERLLAMAQAVREQLPKRFKSVLPATDLPFVAARVRKAALPVSRLRTPDFKAAGWTKRSFCEERIGLTASEGSVVVAMNLFAIHERVDACIDAVLAGRPLPSFPDDPSSTTIRNNPLSRVTDALRVEGQPDRHALRGMSDAGNHTSKNLVKKVVKKIAAGGCGNALRHLRIHPTVWFAR